MIHYKWVLCLWKAVMGNSIPASQKLSAILCFLATGQALQDLKFASEIAPQTRAKLPCS
jgi:hypothetical protein